MAAELDTESEPRVVQDDDGEDPTTDLVVVIGGAVIVGVIAWLIIREVRGGGNAMGMETNIVRDDQGRIQRIETVRLPQVQR